MNTTSIINGQPQQHLPVTDRSISYGDGLFETIACVDGRLQFWSAHLQRLHEGCLRLQLPLIDESLWLEDIRQLDIGDEPVVIKLIISRGSGGRGYKMPGDIQPTRIVSRYDWPSYSVELFNKGGCLKICHTPVSVNPALAGIKHLNRLDNVLARNEWNDENIIDGLMLDASGHVIEGTMSNLFAVEGERLYTPRLEQAGVAGVIRQQVMELAKKLGYECEQINLSVSHLLNMDELFITNSLLGICPIRRLQENAFNDWPLTRKLQQSLDMDGASLAI